MKRKSISNSRSVENIADNIENWGSTSTD